MDLIIASYHGKFGEAFVSLRVKNRKYFVNEKGMPTRMYDNEADARSDFRVTVIAFL